MGSPPRMRGKLKKPAEDFKVKGITPAHAGKTDIESIQNAYNGDHPRACGENTPLGGNMITMPGSPPRVRGKRDEVDRHIYSIGITPACAGKTGGNALLHSLIEDHPRVCGENYELRRHSDRCQGSPPRVRGKLCIRLNALQDNGITPACAGKTTARQPRKRRRRDHPRVCGENPKGYFKQITLTGSPPRVRGKLHKRGLLRGSLGITPACAGKTQTQASSAQ